jgi:hypothetical protein
MAPHRFLERGAAVSVLLLLFPYWLLLGCQARTSSHDTDGPTAKPQARKDGFWAEVEARRSAAREFLNEADQQWDSGKRDEAVEKYMKLVADGMPTEAYHDELTKVFHRLINYRVEKAGAESVRGLIHSAVAHRVVLSLDSKEANAIYAEEKDKDDAKWQASLERSRERREREAVEKPGRSPTRHVERKFPRRAGETHDTEDKPEREASSPEVAGRDYYPTNDDVGLGKRAMTVEQDGKQVLVRRKVPPEHVGLGVTVEGYDAVEEDMTEEEVRSILRSSGKVGTVDGSHKFVAYRQNWSGTKYIQIVYRSGYKAWVVEDKSRFGF